MSEWFTTEVFPHGRGLRVISNAKDVLQQAEQIWGQYPKLSPLPAVPLSIRITEDCSPASTAICRVRGSRILFRGDRQNRAVANLDAGAGHGTFSRSFLQNAAAWRYHFLEPLGYSLIAARHFTLLHASAITANGRAWLLCGDSGAGKTCLAYAAARKRWSFVTGDAAALLRGAPTARISGRPYEIRFRETAAALFPELARFPAELRPNGKRDIEFDPRELGLSTTLEAEVAGVVFLCRSPGVTAALQPISSEELIGRLATSICLGNAALRDAQRSSLLSLLHLPKYRLHYSDLTPAEELLWSVSA